MPGPPAERRTLFHRFFAWFMAKVTPTHEAMVEGHKRRLLGELEGTVVEIGPGTGPNLKFLPEGVRWIGIEPNVHMHDHIRREAARLGLDVEIRTGIAQEMELESDSVDAVVSTLVLCSVRDPDRVLEEIRRILKPGGRFTYIEHVAAPRGTILRRVQRLIRPLWKTLGDGCHPDRETWCIIEGAGFAEVQGERFRVPLPVVAPHIAGVAVKAS